MLDDLKMELAVLWATIISTIDNTYVLIDIMLASRRVAYKTSGPLR